jgi:hypothetical protein
VIFRIVARCSMVAHHKLQPWRWRQQGLRNVGFQSLHSATTQKTTNSNFTAVITLNYASSKITFVYILIVTLSERRQKIKDSRFSITGLVRETDSTLNTVSSGYSALVGSLCKFHLAAVCYGFCPLPLHATEHCVITRSSCCVPESQRNCN